MASEIEGRFLVGSVPDDVVVESVDHLQQGYLAIDDAVEGGVVVRIRQQAAGWVLCIKAGSGLVRTEVERDLDPVEAEQLWLLTTGRRIVKTRRALRLESGDVAEHDTFADDLDGLQIVEVEFASTDAAARFDPPAWFGQEVTQDRGWSNVSLATAGVPP